MTPEPIPVLFVSHGAPTLPLEPDVPAHRFLAGLGNRFQNIAAVLCISAHWNTTRPAVNSIQKPPTIHDFSGFPSELYRIRYPAEGNPGLARRIAGLVEAAGLPCDTDTARGLDHGAWVPLMLIFPEAGIPVIQLSIQDHLDPARHLALGAAIASLRHEGVLIIGSGGAVHPLGDPVLALGEGIPTDSRAALFSEWLNRAVTSGDTESLLRYRDLAPSAIHAQPYPDHFMPLLTALGAAGPGAKGTILHESWYWGNLGMAAYEFR
ncbi:class III extradiol ring-cleavage dioxygenase [uncultured Methanoregula sp.]|uniref:DODA-type extradiol aromatic ring-opening family dioxygenase n=1 Tax=uncultured Methanoregula sp. TaxID=1005933 RepID=UPI002AAB46C5|nr:class III extradiol ring-cleavage dioxygenase [uncultured Methanoregula sp.]